MRRDEALLIFYLYSDFISAGEDSNPETAVLWDGLSQ